MMKYTKKIFSNGSHITPQLVETLQVCREEFQKPIRIASGYRCRLYNMQIGGTKNSYHCLGGAADLALGHLAMGNRKILLQIVCQYFNGIGVYNRHLHVDLGPERIWIGKSV